MTRLGTILCALAGLVLGWTADARANSVTINNSGSTQTLVESDSIPCSSQSGCPTNGFFGSNDYWGANIGTGYQTNSLTATYSAGNGVTTFGSVTLTFNTLFAAYATNGVDPVSGTNYSVYAADIFIASNPSSSTPSSSTVFNYAISLGYTSEGDGGLAAGFYAGTGTGGAVSYDTSTQIWGGRNLDAVYGGGFAEESSFSGSNPACSLTSASCSASDASPTVLTGGTAVTGISEAAPVWNSSADTLTVTLNATNAAGGSELSSIFNNFDIFWGTGDCSNAPIWGNVAGLTSKVPEPSSLALLLVPIALVFYRRRKRVPA